MRPPRSATELLLVEQALESPKVDAVAIEITAEAIEVLKNSLEIAKHDPERVGVRLRGSRALGGGFQVQVEFAEQPESNDVLVDGRRRTDLRGPRSARDLPRCVDHSRADARHSDGQTGLSIYRTEEGRAEIIEWCERRLVEVDLPLERQTLETGLGDSHVTTMGTGPSTVVLLPGTNFNIASWLEVAIPLAKQHRVVSIDLPGQPGLSTPERHKHANDLYGIWLAETLKDARDRIVRPRRPFAGSADRSGRIGASAGRQGDRRARPRRNRSASDHHCDASRLR